MDPLAQAIGRPRLATLKRRADFLAAARARRQSRPGFTLQARRREPAEAVEGIRVGYTCSKKVGNAVARNRAKRRLREAARAVLPEFGQQGWDYVLIGRPGETAARDFALMCEELRGAVGAIHAPRAPR
jgi:ribonuclease P protein component